MEKEKLEYLECLRMFKSGGKINETEKFKKKVFKGEKGMKTCGCGKKMKMSK